jgi:hypothetical protein
MKRLALVLAVLVAILAWFFWPRPGATKTGPVAPNQPELTASSAASRSAIENRQSKIENSADGASPIAEKLNAPGGTIRRDLEMLNEVFAAWQTNFPHDGNPVGENAEITAALTGRNKLHFAFISPQNPAINARGELCDRWGTPFFFHALSGTHMEIRSAGPDKKMWTDDDVTLTP